MIRKYILGMISIAAIVLTSCSDQYLENMKDYSGFNEQVFTEPSMAAGYVDYIYNQMEPGNNSTPIQTLGDGINYSTTFSTTTDEFAGTTSLNNNGSTLTNSSVSTYFGSPLSGSIVNNPYTRIKQINLFLENIDVYGKTTITLAQRNKMKGQMYFWRAWQYFDLVRLYGGVPMVMHSQKPSSTDTTIRIPRSTTTKCISLICQDLDSAITLLPATMVGNDYGRIDKAAAAAFKARVLSTIATPVFNSDWQNISSAKWQAAYDAHVAALPYLDAAGKGLYGESKPGTRAKAWSDMFKQSLNGQTRKVNPEAIIVYLYSSAISSGSSAYKANGWENAIRTTLSGGGASIKTTAQMIDKFPMADGTRPVKGVNYDTLNFFVNRDPRFYRTFAFNGSFWPYKDSISNATVWSYYWQKNATSPTTLYYAEAGSMPSGGAFVRKMSQDGNIAKADFLYSVSDIIEFRYAEFLLNWAECAAGINHLQEAYDILKRIRIRASIPAGTDGTYGLGTDILNDRYKMFEAILYERSIELAYEGKRFWDLRNWELFGNTDNGDQVCNLLGITPLNGTRRTGFYIQVDPGKAAVSALNSHGYGTGNGLSYDPLYKAGVRPKYDGSSINATVGRVDPDASDANWNIGITNLQTFYNTYLKRVYKNDLDATKSPVFSFAFLPQYYFFGINQNVLQANDYLNDQQTKGWLNVYGQSGTFDPTE
ncbi:MAG: RagB/SusD family nutrient uptake outer membrane protein [Bacteroidota bacterium]|nr:RagB/SusD family nutrient uptake outer membrane protein [Bacteroidota bacterium]MDP4273517.1 RagB/SusD family nutrient uptake outer membrane protein [Bacteroidota bacterium]